MRKKCFLLAIVLTFSVLLATNASAYLIMLTDPNTDLSGYQGPYAQVNVVLSSSSTATITATALNGYHFIDGSALALNVNAANYISVTSIAYTGLQLPSSPPP